MPNEYSQEIVDKILEMSRRFPSYSYVRIAGQLQIEGVSVSPGGVRKVWERNGLVKKLSRYLWLEREVSEGRGIMTETALKAVNRLKRLKEATDQHVEANRPGELISQDLYFVGVIKGVGKIYLQSAVDCSCSMGFARLCVSKQPIHAVALLHERVVPFYDSLGINLGSVLTDCGREYCGRPDSHFFELYLGSLNIEHRKTRPASPYTNGFAERFHRTLKDEFFAKAFREKIYGSLDDLQRDLDAFIEFYNTGRIHSGYRCEGRTPLQTLKDLLSAPKSEATELQAA
jgi:transposase InsO family protein